MTQPTRVNKQAVKLIQADSELRAANTRIAELESQVRELQWRQIAPESLPQGFPHDECLHRGGYVGTLGTLSYGERRTYERVIDLGWTHYRPINAPRSEREGEKP